MFKHLIIFALFAAVYSQSNGSCNCKTGDGYACYCTNVVINEATTSFNVAMIHETGKCNADVTFLQFEGGNITYNSPIITKAFPDLLKLRIRSGLTKLVPMQNCNKLWWISFAGNHALTTVNPGIFDACASTLKHLDISYNGINTVAETAFDPLINLEVLSLSHDELNCINPRLFSQLVNLKELYLSANNFVSIPADAFPTLNRLKIINFMDNNTVDIHPTAFQGLTSLSSLHLHGNQLKRIGNLFPKISTVATISLDNNKIEAIHPQFFHFLTLLRTITLPANICVNKTFTLTKYEDLATVVYPELQTCFGNFYAGCY